MRHLRSVSYLSFQSLISTGSPYDLAKKALPGMTDEELEQALKENEVAGEPDTTDLRRGQTDGRPDRPAA